MSSVWQDFTAPTPPELPPEKYDATVASMIALLRYGSGLPFNRVQRLQQDLGEAVDASNISSLLTTANIRRQIEDGSAEGVNMQRLDAESN
ncbi:MAG: hypothetical protein R3E01_06150 [Pirellulaceae bacterium]|nr:hypothetical protein [Planctomycetales bacterium]